MTTTFETTLSGVLAYFKDWRVDRVSTYGDGTMITLFDDNTGSPLICFSMPHEEEGHKRVAAVQIMTFTAEEDMWAFGSLASSLFAKDGVDILVVEFEEEFAKSKKPLYKASEKYVLDRKTTRMRVPFHFAHAFENGLLKHVGAIQAFSPRLNTQLSDGDGYFVVYAREKEIADSLTGLFDYALGLDEMKEVPNRFSETANDKVVKRTEFSHLYGKARFLWECPRFAIKLQLETLECFVEEKRRF